MKVVAVVTPDGVPTVVATVPRQVAQLAIPVPVDGDVQLRQAPETIPYPVAQAVTVKVVPESVQVAALAIPVIDPEVAVQAAQVIELAT